MVVGGLSVVVTGFICGSDWGLSVVVKGVYLW